MPIRHATLADLDALVAPFEAYRTFYAQPADPEGARAFLGARLTLADSVILLAKDEAGDVLGFTQLFPSFTSAAMKRLFILNDLFVVPAARGQGIGAALLQAAADHARHVGAVRLRLATALDNLPAQRLYEAQGWARDTHFCTYDLSLG